MSKRMAAGEEELLSTDAEANARLIGRAHDTADSAGAAGDNRSASLANHGCR